MRRPRLKRPGLKRTYTVPEAAALLRVTPQTIRQMMRDGRLRWIQAAGRRRVVGGSLWAVSRVRAKDRRQTRVRTSAE